MKRAALILAGLAMAGAVMLLVRNRQASQAGAGIEPAPVETAGGMFGAFQSAADWVASWGEPAPEVFEPTAIEQEASMSGYIEPGQAARNVAAFLMMIRTAEGTAGPNGYRTFVGGGLFDSFADHPRQVLSGTFANGKAWRSSAAGAYQFIAATWDDCKRALNLPDFSPASQDRAAVYLIRRRGALPAVEAGRVAEAVNLCRREWASLPGAGYGQPEQALARLEIAYQQAGGAFA